MKAIMYPNTFVKNRKFYTRSLYDFKGFDEKILTLGSKKYREVEASRSKLFAGIAKGVSQLGIKEGINVLYLGASHGYTASFLSDMIGKQGRILCIDVAPRVVRDLVFVCEQRTNMAPILANCRNPSTYEEYVPELVDLVFQDIAQRDQVSIFIKNVKQFLKTGGFGILALKARSVDVSKKPSSIYKDTYRELSKEFTVGDKRDLSPIEKDHMLFVIKK